MIAGPTLSLTLTAHGSPITRIGYAKRLRPFSAGYALVARSQGAQTFVGINHPGSIPGGGATGVPNRKLYRIVGNGAANSASPFSYDLTALGAIPQFANGVVMNPLPTTNAAGILPASGYANAIATVYADIAKQGESASVVERIGTGGANVNRQFWRVDTGTTLTLAYGYTGGQFVDLPKGWVLEIVVPDAADITAGSTTLVADADTVVRSADFLINGDGTLTNVTSFGKAVQ
jgi:hypothetical protein